MTVGYRSSRPKALSVVEEIVSGSGEAFASPVDVTDERSVEAFVRAAAERFGGIDVVVNAFGRIDARDAVRFDDIDALAWDALFRVDVKGTFLMCQATVPYLRRSSAGVIVNFSGSYGNGTNQENLVNSVAVAYCAAKGAIRAFTAALSARPGAPQFALMPSHLE